MSKVSLKSKNSDGEVNYNSYETENTLSTAQIVHMIGESKETVKLLE